MPTGRRSGPGISTSGSTPAARTPSSMPAPTSLVTTRSSSSRLSTSSGASSAWKLPTPSVSHARVGMWPMSIRPARTSPSVPRSFSISPRRQPPRISMRTAPSDSRSTARVHSPTSGSPICQFDERQHDRLDLTGAGGLVRRRPAAGQQRAPAPPAAAASREASCRNPPTPGSPAHASAHGIGGAGSQCRHVDGPVPSPWRAGDRAA